MAGDWQSFSLADYTWVKVNKCSWWPAQIVDEATISKKCISNRKASARTLVRLYGTYIYLYVDILKCRSEFQNVLRQNNCCARVEFQKALEKLTHGIQKCSNLKRNLQRSEGVEFVEIGEHDEIESKIPKQSEKKAKIPRKRAAETYPKNSAKKRKAGGNNVEGPLKVKRQKADKLQNSLKPGRVKQTGKSKNGGFKQHDRKKLEMAKRLKANSSKKTEGARVQTVKQKRSREVKVKVKTASRSGALRLQKISQSAGKNSTIKMQKKEVRTLKTSMQMVKNSKVEMRGSAKKQKQAEVSGPGEFRSKQKATEKSGADPTVTKTSSRVKNSVREGARKISEAKNLNMARTPESTRRIKVMQSLGLIAPCGSPFRNGLTTRR